MKPWCTSPLRRGKGKRATSLSPLASKRQKVICAALRAKTATLTPPSTEVTPKGSGVPSPAVMAGLMGVSRPARLRRASSPPCLRGSRLGVHRDGPNLLRILPDGAIGGEPTRVRGVEHAAAPPGPRIAPKRRNLCLRAHIRIEIGRHHEPVMLLEAAHERPVTPSFIR